MTLNKLLEEKGLGPDSIEKIYHGKDSWCRCGCGGKYFYSETPEDARGFKMAMNKLNNEEKFDSLVRARDIESCNNWINIPVGDGYDNKCYCIYIKH